MTEDQEIAYRRRQAEMGCTCFPTCVRHPSAGAPVFVHDVECGLFDPAREKRRRVLMAAFN